MKEHVLVYQFQRFGLLFALIFCACGFFNLFFSWALLKIKALGIMIACVTINRKVKKTKQRSRKNFRNTSFSIDNYVDVVL